ncbi:reverse transcriptase domain-containing protein [Tanacetum coccineum]|uniref:Reverse transcriptase domain-containing protein n=1 Tax=Tanacetum coccineum TaxID=301880 RepID=A0ABQ5IM06_9ASTR
MHTNRLRCTSKLEDNVEGNDSGIGDGVNNVNMLTRLVGFPLIVSRATFVARETPLNDKSSSNVAPILIDFLVKVWRKVSRATCRPGNVSPLLLLMLLVQMSADVARGHGGDGSGDDRPPPHQIPTGCGGCLGNRAGRQHTRQETRNLGLKAITDKSGPVPIRFEFGDRETLMPLGEHAAHWANYLGELVRELPLHHPSWRQVPPEEKAGVMARIGIAFWNDPKNRARAAQNKQNRAKSKVVCRQGSRSIAALRDMHMESSATREYPSLIHTFFLTHTVNGVFLNPKDKVLYDEMLRLQGLGFNTKTGVPYTEDEIMAIVRGGKQRGHIPGVGRVLPGQRTVNMFMKLFRSDDKFSQMLSQLESQPEIGGDSGSGGYGDDEQGDDEDDDEDGEDEDDS